MSKHASNEPHLHLCPYSQNQRAIRVSSVPAAKTKKVGIIVSSGLQMFRIKHVDLISDFR